MSKLLRPILVLASFALLIAYVGFVQGCARNQKPDFTMEGN